MIVGFGIGYILIFELVEGFEGGAGRPVPIHGGEIGVVLGKSNMFELAGC